MAIIRWLSGEISDRTNKKRDVEEEVGAFSFILNILLSDCAYCDKDMAECLWECLEVLHQHMPDVAEEIVLGHLDAVRMLLMRWPDDCSLRIRVLAVIAAYADGSLDCKRLVSLYVPWCIRMLSVSLAPFRSQTMIALVNIIGKAAYAGDLAAIKALLRFSQDPVILKNYVGCKRAYFASLRDALLRNEARVIPVLLADPEITPEHKELLRAISYSGIKWIDRFYCDDLLKIIAQRLELADSLADDKPLAVAVYALADKRAFLENRPLFRELLRHGYRVVYFEVGGKNAFASALVSAAQVGPAQVLIVAGHGTPEWICLGGRHGRFSGEDQPGISIQDEGFLLEAGVDRALAPGGTVLLISCSTGKGGERADNIANMFGRIFASRDPGHIFAPIRDTFLVDVDIYPVKGIVSVSWGFGGAGYDAAGTVAKDGGYLDIVWDAAGLVPEELFVRSGLWIEPEISVRVTPEVLDVRVLVGVGRSTIDLAALRLTLTDMLTVNGCYSAEERPLWGVGLELLVRGDTKVEADRPGRKYYSITYIYLNPRVDVRMRLHPLIRCQGIGQLWYRGYIEPFLRENGYGLVSVPATCGNIGNVAGFWRKQGFEMLQLNAPDSLYMDVEFLLIKSIKKDGGSRLPVVSEFRNGCPGGFSGFQRAWDDWGEGGYSRVPAKEKDFEKVDIFPDLIGALVREMPSIHEYARQNGSFLTPCISRYL
jgi:hypothetical protein